MKTQTPFTYPSPAVPADYLCSRCKWPGLKLWRQYNTFLIQLNLLCAACIDPAVKVERDGMHKDRFGQLSDQMTDSIGTEVFPSAALTRPSRPSCPGACFA